jgi:fluoroquinolone transport system permease protein
VAIPESARSNATAWVPAILAVNLQITTFFFVAGLILLERDEGTLTALAVSPVTPGGYLLIRTVTLTGLAAAETVAVVWIGFGAGGSWLHILAGTAALGLIYTSLGAAVATRYASINELLLPASVVVTLLLLPLLSHFGFTSRAFFLAHPIEPALTLIRAGYSPFSAGDVMFGLVGSSVWGALTFFFARHRLDALFRDTRASGGR